MPALRNIFVFLTVFLFCVCSFVAEICADTHTASTCSYSDVLTAYTAASAGDTVSIPAGSCTWSSTLSITKSINLIGAGSSSTILTGTASPMVTVAHGASGFARVSGIYFNTTGTSTALKLSGTIYQVRIDHNKFGGSDYGVFASGLVEGVVDNNEFINCDRCVMGSGPDTPAWTIDFNPVTGNFIAGGSHALFFEDNIFTRNASFSRAGNELHYMQEGMRVVFRYNTVDMSAWSGNNYAWEVHGNQTYYDSQAHPPDTFRGQPISEIYNNEFILRGSPRVIAPRSGSLLIFNNTITVNSPGSLSGLLHFCEEETYTEAGAHFYGKNDFVWPTEDMITNTFIWNNTVNGSALTTSNVNGCSASDCCGTYPDVNYVINFNRDVWMHEPQSSGGRTYYDGRPGASGRDADGTLVFTTVGANAYYPYTPYTYPHPLRNEVGPNPPTGLRIAP